MSRGVEEVGLDVNGKRNDRIHLKLSHMYICTHIYHPVTQSGQVFLAQPCMCGKLGLTESN